ncbi:precorrin-6y C5,15-methyltransferase (decarboxylating) subunit CbiE [Diaphorobacter caeni]|uniref:precorrin-6y C5,15-methyltransferase (decarboxylating) subunit CbiE n=1 Tax=Diaphorobacter caeni TaxID=2784387 RepID=UPI00188EA595|nr:precorrin-6y C5,15-methyltransferase (decarboxylating) subunit CbiE [Diaphorobacter caeni]MBF5006288.1 precorrin-6y C5,15-methyltransferase (decarboxylating) subunit CbiE [Diaphorobacter caeni]
MANPWLFIIGIHPSGLDGLSAAARRDLDDASIVFGSPRHLALADVASGEGERGRAWPVPFDVAPVLALRGQTRVAVLVSGDPFHFGGGASLARCLDVGEWRNHPQPSTFSWIAGELGWSLEDTQCLGLHARPFATLTPLLSEGQRFVCLVRDGAAGQRLADWLNAQGWGKSPMWLVSHAGSDLQRISSGTAREIAMTETAREAPLAVAWEARGGNGFTRVPGRGIDAFAHDGQITKSPVRAMTLAALAPRRGECLWDLGAGSGSVAIEWCLAGGQAVCVERNTARVANIEQNALRYAAALQVVQGDSLALLAQLQPEPHAVFVGGGFNRELFGALRERLQGPWRLVVNAVALETQALLMELHRVHGGQLLQLQWSEAVPLGGMQTWQAARPVVQWNWNAA